MKEFTDTTAFTDNDTIDSTELYDSSAELVGFVGRTYPRVLAKNGFYVKRILIDNGQGRIVQLIAWANNTRVLEKFEAGEVLCIERVYSNPAKPNSLYNGGNTKFELVASDRSNINILGTYDPPETLAPAPASTTVTFDNIKDVQGLVKLGGYIKNSFRELKMKNGTLGVGSITDGHKKIEIHINKFKKEEDECMFLKGQYVEVTGNLQTRQPAPPYIRVESTANIHLDQDKPRESLQFLLDGYVYVEWILSYELNYLLMFTFSDLSCHWLLSI